MPILYEERKKVIGRQRWEEPKSFSVNLCYMGFTSISYPEIITIKC